MIITKCPYCDEPKVVCWECGDPSGWFPVRCEKCKKVMWIEATSMDGETLTHEEFLEDVCHPGDEDRVNEAAFNAK